MDVIHEQSHMEDKHAVFTACVSARVPAHRYEPIDARRSWEAAPEASIGTAAMPSSWPCGRQPYQWGARVTSLLPVVRY